MRARSSAQRLKSLEESVAAAAAERYDLRLYVIGPSPKSSRAIRNITRICQDRLAGRYDLEVVDLYQQPERGIQDQIIAAPTLIKSTPAPVRRLIGDLSEEASVLRGLGLSNAAPAVA